MLSLRKCLKDVVNFAKILPKISVGTSHIQIDTLLVQWGTVDITSVGSEINTGRNYGTKTITFTKAYSAAPKILLGQDGLSNYLATMGTTSVTATKAGITMAHTREVSTTISCDWLAIGEAK